MLPVKLLDASSGESAPFQFADNSIDYKWVIVGTPGANIKIFCQEKVRDMNAASISVKCSDWNGASVKLQSKTLHPEDEYSDADEVFTKDEQVMFSYTR